MDTKFESTDNSAALLDEVRAAIETDQALRIRGGDSKAFLGRSTDGKSIDTRSHRGIVTYDPTELVVTVRAGTPVAELEATLDTAGQMLPSEAPVFAGNATVGGMVASGLSGPRRPWGGSVRDFVLGCRIITGTGKHLRFGGEVMKNVAGYDISRLTAGSFGALGLITEVSLKVLPKPRASLSLAQSMTSETAISKISKWRSEGVPVTGACHVQDTLYVRIEGGEGSVKAARELVGGEETPYDFWTALREFQLPFFSDRRPLWRLSLPASAPHINLPGTAVIDWGGSQRWLKSDESEGIIREIAHRHGGHGACYTPGVSDQPFHPLPVPLLKLHQRLKKELDPSAIFNPGRMYADL
ncbi:Glycolate oxidase, FAD-binding subunit GlcE [Paraburkholderia caribensis MBA4]|uniref:Glycolate oxidase, FAD-binding subunit GlcE n=1 Tax=Paraburkholderia caribensis MBA4 TaxID=1323664 RepID=A0A0P0RID9_9BURK|nr:glycolate oxidase subunit GlcE [Paraburkholderia caribensis]ALL68328.1 Glycolate oxidase, FAD-binding subunit GlcE [Paraburkholderia caribensis MBA4]